MRKAAPRTSGSPGFPQTLRDALKLDWDRLRKCLPQPEQLEAAKNLMKGSRVSHVEFA